MWYRAKVEKVSSGSGKVSVLYIDYGNRADVQTTQCAPLPPGLDINTDKPYAHYYTLAFVSVSNEVSKPLLHDLIMMIYKIICMISYCLFIFSLKTKNLPKVNLRHVSQIELFYSTSNMKLMVSDMSLCLTQRWTKIKRNRTLENHWYQMAISLYQSAEKGNSKSWWVQKINFL